MADILKGIDLSVLEDNNALNEGEAVDNILKTLDFDIVEANKNLEKKDKEETSVLENAKDAKKELEEDRQILTEDEKKYTKFLQNIKLMKN